MTAIGKRTYFDLSPAAVALATKKTRAPDSEEETPLDKPAPFKSPTETHADHVQALKHALSEMQIAIGAKYAVFFGEYDRVKARRKWIEESGKDLSDDDETYPIWPRSPNGKDCELRDAVGMFVRLYESKPPGQISLIGFSSDARHSLMVAIGVVGDGMMNVTEETTRSEIIRIIGASELSAFRSRITRVPASSIIHLVDGRAGLLTKFGVLPFSDKNRAISSAHRATYYFIVDP